MAAYNENQFSQERMMPKAFQTIQVGETVKHDPSGREHIWKQRSSSYSRSNRSTGGYVRNSLKSTLDD
jgi:hypothetical protein